MPNHPPAHQHLREFYRVGDWVIASSVPEWKTDRVTQMFTPPNQVSAGLFGASAIPAKDWKFHGSFIIDDAGDTIAIWRREE